MPPNGSSMQKEARRGRFINHPLYSKWGNGMIRKNGDMQELGKRPEEKRKKNGLHL